MAEASVRKSSHSAARGKFKEHGERNNCPTSSERVNLRIASRWRTVAFTFILLSAFYGAHTND